MRHRIINKVFKAVTALALVIVIATPAAAAIESTQPISSVNTVTTNKNDWVTSMQNYKVSSVQKTSIILYRGNGHDNAVILVKVGALLDGEWQRVIGPASGVRMVKNDTKADFDLSKNVPTGKQMRIRLKLATESANSGFGTDKVTNAWWWY